MSFPSPGADDEHVAGGTLSGRIIPARSSTYSPYGRSPPLPAAQSSNPKWFTNLMSGAGKLISSVFRSESDEGSQSSSEDEEEMDLSAAEELNQRKIGRETLGNEAYGTQAIVLKSKTKSVIEQLIMQETFSRDEYNELTRIIQSRIIDSPENYDIGRPGNITNMFTCNTTTFTGAWRSLDRLNKFPERSSYYSTNFGSPSPGSFQQWTPELRDKAIMEAMKYLKEKKLETSSRYDTDCGPCNLNTNVLNSGESENDSPVVVAKSYMESLPPWHSPVWTSTGFKTPSPATMQLYGNESLKRDYLSIGSYNEVYERRNVRLKSTDEAALTGQRNSQLNTHVEAINSILEPESVQEGTCNVAVVGEQVSNTSAAGISASQISVSMELGGDDDYSYYSGDHLIPTNAVAPEEMNSMKPSSHQGVSNADSRISFGNRKILESELPNISREQQPDETAAQDTARLQKDGNDSTNRIIENGEETEATNFNKGKRSAESLEPNTATVNADAVHRTNSVIEEPQSSVSTRSMEHMLVETPSMTNSGRKKMVRTRRGRGNLR